MLRCEITRQMLQAMKSKRLSLYVRPLGAMLVIMIYIGGIGVTASHNHAKPWSMNRLTSRSSAHPLCAPSTANHPSHAQHVQQQQKPSLHANLECFKNLKKRKKRRKTFDAVIDGRGKRIPDHRSSSSKLSTTSSSSSSSSTSTSTTTTTTSNQTQWIDHNHFAVPPKLFSSRLARPSRAVPASLLNSQDNANKWNNMRNKGNAVGSHAGTTTIPEEEEEGHEDMGASSSQSNLTTNATSVWDNNDDDEEGEQRANQTNCDRWITSDQGLNGTIVSPNFPQPYPARLKCLYHFVGRGKERVQIIFEEFDVFKVEDQHRDCELSDSVTAYTHTNGQKEWIDDFCGGELPPKIMSNGPRMILEFKSLHHNQESREDEEDEDEHKERMRRSAQQSKHKSYRDFMLRRKPTRVNHARRLAALVEDSKTSAVTRFQIDDRKREASSSHHTARNKSKSPDRSRRKRRSETPNAQNREETKTSSKKGKKKKKKHKSKAKLQQQPTRRLARGFRASYRFVTNFGIETGRQDSKAVCAFIYNSTLTGNGTFTSPNHPGYYPKDTECHYFFYGRPNEHISIKFVHFDVEGVLPCTIETASDYIEFSNFYSSDRRTHRHCGLKDPKSIESEGDFMRVTFKSNGRFDGTGFKATYEFQNKGYAKKKIQSSVSTSMSTSGASVSLSSFSLVLLLTISSTSQMTSQIITFQSICFPFP